MPLDLPDLEPQPVLKGYAKTRQQCQDRIRAAAEAELHKPLANMTAKELAAVADPINSLESKAAHRKLIRELAIAEREAAQIVAVVDRFNKWQADGMPADEMVVFEDMVIGLIPG